MDAPERMTTLPSWLLSRAAQRGHEHVSAALAEAGLRKNHYSTLVALEELGAVSQAELGRRLWMDRSDLHALVGDLEARGLITRAPDERDRRRNVVALTPAGTRRLRELDERVDAAQRALLEPLPANQQAQLVRLLKTLVSAG